jgi:nucleotidyltransferase substrate binding protein (TIGR01987 family)
MDPAAVDFSRLESALRSLAQAVEMTQAQGPGITRSIYRDAAILRFKRTFELSWTLMRRVHLALGRTDIGASPKPILRRAGRDGFIDDVALWLKFLEARDNTALAYDEVHADSAYAMACAFRATAQDLVENLRSALNCAQAPKEPLPLS